MRDGPTHIGKDGKTVQERLQGHVDLMAQDIRECANACDTYAKTKLLHKVLRGSRWDDVLQIFVRRFNKRRGDIEFALAVHLGINVDIAHRKLDTLDSKYVQFNPLTFILIIRKAGSMQSLISFAGIRLPSSENSLRLYIGEADRRLF